jgi:hypothetical protein
MASNVSAEPALDDIELPSDLAETVRRVGDRDEPPATLGECFAVFETVLDDQGVALALPDMYQSHRTRHAVGVDGTVEFVPCVLDALIVAVSVEADPVGVRSSPPAGGPTVDFEVDGGSVSVAPETAVLSFGVAHEDARGGVTRVKDTLAEESAIPATCTYINAFPDRSAYEEWAADVEDAAVMGLGLPEIAAVARRGAEQYREA